MARVSILPGDVLQPIRGGAMRVVENMEASLQVPTATSVRTIPVRTLEENRRLLNKHREAAGQGKVSFTHLVAWAILRAFDTFPRMNDAYAEVDGQAHRIQRDQVRLGIAVDVQKKDGSRTLLVPNVKDAQKLSFAEFLKAFDELVARSRKGTISPDDFMGTTVSLTNPGTVGTTSSAPRLMPGQGVIVATGALDYPAEYKSMAPRTLGLLGISKVMTLTSTYDHRIIQGAESGLFLARMEDLLKGEDGFYDRVFADLGLPHRPVKWEMDANPGLFGTPGGREEVEKQTKVLQLIHNYRVRGHLVADLDPLDRARAPHRDLDPATYGLTLWDLDREFLTGGLSGEDKGDAARDPRHPARDLLRDDRRRVHVHRRPRAQGVAAAPHGVDAQLPGPRRGEQEAGAREDRGGGELRALPPHEVRRPQALLARGRGGAHPAARPHPQRRGAARAARGRDRHVAPRAAQRPRHHRRQAPLPDLRGVRGQRPRRSYQGSGDVKYHLGATGTHLGDTGETITVTVAPNPSHLEFVDPVVEGMVRAKQDAIGDREHARVLPVLLHGDAAFAGQGVVAETMHLSGLHGYRTGGTIHVVVNNQIGFTTLPEDARSSTYATDVAKMVHAPAFHVNGDDPEAVAYVAGLALEYRQKFRKDVVIDLVCYRRWGHNETDEPSYTQPIMYAKIKTHPSAATLYGEKLVREGVVTREELERVWAGKKAEMQSEKEGDGTPFVAIARRAPVEPAPVDASAMWGRLKTVLRALGTLPDGLEIHPKLVPFVRKRAELLDGKGDVDWATGGVARLGDAPSRGSPGAPLRAGLRPRHLLAAPRRPPRRADAEGVRALQRGRPLGRALRGLRLAALRGRRDGLRVRLLGGRAPHARAVGGAVRRLHERCAGHHRPVPLGLGDEVGPAERAHPAAAARARGPGAGALERAHRALPHALGRGQPARRLSLDARLVLPPAAPAGPGPRREAPGRLHPQEPAAPPALRLVARRTWPRAASSR